MKTQYLSEEQIKEYERLSALAKGISDAITAFELGVLSAEVPQEVKVRCLEIAQDLNTFGLAYRLHPQSEWMGGNNTKVRAPHIAQQQ